MILFGVIFDKQMNFDYILLMSKSGGELLILPKLVIFSKEPTQFLIKLFTEAQFNSLIHGVH